MFAVYLAGLKLFLTVKFLVLNRLKKATIFSHQATLRTYIHNLLLEPPNSNLQPSSTTYVIILYMSDGLMANYRFF